MEHPRDKNYPHYKEKYKYVTTWCGKQFPPFDADKIATLILEKSGDTTETKESLKKKWKNTATYGKKVHKEIEDFYNTKKDQGKTEEYSQFLKFNIQAIEWGWEIFRSEWKIYDEDLKICGCIDALFKHGDKYIICDWKTSKEIKKENEYENALTKCISHLPNANFWHYSLQLNYYKYILEKKYYIKVEKMILVNLLKDSYTIYEIDDMQDSIQKLNLCMQSFKPKNENSN